MIRAIAAANLREYWHWMRPALDTLRERCAESWIPEDIYAALKAGHCVLLVVGERDGFLIAETRPGSDGRGLLFIWICYGRLRQHEAAIYAWIDAQLATLNLRAAQFISPREEWGCRDFWKCVGHVYEHEATKR